MNKNIFGVILVFGLVSMISLFIAIFMWAFNNDYILYNVNVQAEYLENNSVISQSDLDNIESMGNKHASLNFYFDEWWLLSYIVMLVSTIFVSYYSREDNLFSFLGTLFFGTMVFLFVLGVITQVNTYLLEDIFYKMLPTIEGSMPMFEFYMNNAGIISFIHLLVCILVNRLYLKINEFAKKEDVFDDAEVL